MDHPPTPTTHPVHDVLRSGRKPLDSIFMPKSVAVIGATEKPGTVGRTILHNLLSSPFGGTVFPVNPARSQVLGVKSYSTIGEVPEEVELAIIVTPAQTVPGILRDCGARAVQAAIVISAGFKEVGPEGALLENQVLEEARRSGIRVIGPNCFGVMNPPIGMNATFSRFIARPGSIAFVSQSGALCASVLDWSMGSAVGFSSFVSVGSMVDVNWGDLIYYFGDDPRTNVIALYMESIGDARSFLSAAREVALTKPIIVIKAGRTEAAAQAAASHTGALTGSDEVLAAAFRRCGALRVDTISDLFYMAEVLAKQPRPKGNRLAIVTNAGGPGVLAADALMAGGGELATLAPETIAQISEFLSPHWSHSNPVDTLGDANAEKYERALEIVAGDPNADGVLAILAAQGMAHPTETAERIKPLVAKFPKPLLASWMGGADTAAGDAILNANGVPCFPHPETAVRIFNFLWRYSSNLRALYETPSLAESAPPDRGAVDGIVQAARRAGRTLLDEFESKRVLSAYGIPTVHTRVAGSAEEAVLAAKAIGFPVVLKLYSHTVTHKTDVGGVKLNLQDAAAVERAFRDIENSVREKKGEGHFQGVTVQPMVARDGYELIVGSSLDPQFGPVLLFGAGGQLVEVFEDRALGLPPLNSTLARRMMERTRIFKALAGVRGRKPVDLAALENLLVRFSTLVVEQPWIQEIDINPLLASPEGLLALDARVVVHGAGMTEDALPHPAVRPYPSHYVQQWTMKDGSAVTIRPIRPEDEPLMIDFHRSLSERSVYLRYFNVLKLSQRIAHERLTRTCFADYDREMALVAEQADAQGRRILGVGRLSKLHGVNEAELAVLISDLCQRRGLGTELVRRLLEIAADERLARVNASFLPENQEMFSICAKLGFRVEKFADSTLKAIHDLRDVRSVSYAVR